MTNKTHAKRKLPVQEIVEEKESFSEEDDDDLLNTVNGEDEDSSDSDVEYSDSEVEDENESNDEEDLEEASDEEDSDDIDAESTENDEETSEIDDHDQNGTEDEDNLEDQNPFGEETESSDEEKASTSKSNNLQQKPSNSLKKLVEKTSKAIPNDTKDDDEYAVDSSDEEDIRNTVGNIPMNWYDEYKHLGYDWDGKKIIKPAMGDQLDEFLKKMEDPDFWRTVKDPQTGQDVVLSEADLNLIKRIQGQRIPDEQFDDYAPWIEWFTSQVEQMPIRKFPDHKRSFLPSKTEAKKVSKLVHALKMGWIKTLAEKAADRAKKSPQFYMLWSTDDQEEEQMRRIHKHIAAPKRNMPGHAESYNPPPEYLFDEKELKQFERQKNAPWKRKLHFVPQKFDSLRQVPAYPRYMKERFLRCLDLYLAPRAIKMRLTIEPESLVPKLPSPRDLQPFPTVQSIIYRGHKDMIRSFSIDKSGQYIVSGSDDCTIKLWEVNTGRCLKTIEIEATVRSVEWCPNSALSLILVAANNMVLLINPHVGDTLICEKTDELLKDTPKSDALISERVRTTVQWEDPSDDEYKKGIRMVLKHFKTVAQVTWHAKGDYFATVMPEGANRSVLISQLSKRRSQLPFTKSKGLVQCVLFHPTKPLLFVATQRHVRVYDLVKQTLVKKLMTLSKWISKMAVHSGGDNLLVATYDRKILWFDLDLSTKPYQTLRLHGTAVRGIAFHKRYPLFASGSDDRNLIVSHGMVYNDLLKNPLIVPLKRIQDHEPFNDFGIFDVKFHPLQPWVFSSGADSTIRLYCN